MKDEPNHCESAPPRAGFSGGMDVAGAVAALQAELDKARGTIARQQAQIDQLTSQLGDGQIREDHRRSPSPSLPSSSLLRGNQQALASENKALLEENEALKEDLAAFKRRAKSDFSELGKCLEASKQHQQLMEHKIRNQQKDLEAMKQQQQQQPGAVSHRHIADQELSCTELAVISGELHTKLQDASSMHQSLVRNVNSCVVPCGSEGLKGVKGEGESGIDKERAVDAADSEEQIRRVQQFMERTGLKQHALARRVGCSQGTLSSWLKQKYAGDVGRITVRVQTALDVLEKMSLEQVQALDGSAAAPTVRRRNFTREQVEILEQVALDTPNPKSAMVEKLSQAFEREQRHIVKWFSNWRSRKCPSKLASAAPGPKAAPPPEDLSPPPSPPQHEGDGGIAPVHMLPLVGPPLGGDSGTFASVAASRGVSPPSLVPLVLPSAPDQPGLHHHHHQQQHQQHQQHQQQHHQQHQQQQRQFQQFHQATSAAFQAGAFLPLLFQPSLVHHQVPAPVQLLPPQQQHLHLHTHPQPQLQSGAPMEDPDPVASNPMVSALLQLHAGPRHPGL